MSDRRIGIGTVITRSLYGLYAWAVFALCALIALAGVLVVPGQDRRSRLTSAMARAVFTLAGVRPTIEGLENLPEGNAVLVANHASYVDGPLLKGYMPHQFSFVIKGEMRKVPIAHFLLRRSGSRFVERFDSGGSARDARKIVKAAQDGAPLGFFPEGTFLKEPGVGRFRPGAFVAAARAGVPVVPIAISGTREMMPSGRNWPWPVRPRIRVLPPIQPDHPSFGNHRELAEIARQQILAVLGEPDLCTVPSKSFNED
jgi:1-acyl-sn-glycerol-3-phosphate acyltransferase